MGLVLSAAAGHRLCLFRFKEVFYDESYLAIVMEYASQGHLSSLLARQGKGKLSETDARRYINKSRTLQVLSGPVLPVCWTCACNKIPLC